MMTNMYVLVTQGLWTCLSLSYGVTEPPTCPEGMVNDVYNGPPVKSIHENTKIMIIIVGKERKISDKNRVLDFRNLK